MKEQFQRSYQFNKKCKGKSLLFKYRLLQNYSNKMNMVPEQKKRYSLIKYRIQKEIKCSWTNFCKVNIPLLLSHLSNYRMLSASKNLFIPPVHYSPEDNHYSDIYHQRLVCLVLNIL